MGHNLRQLVAEVDIRLAAHPRLLLHDLTRDLAVNRHIIEEAIRKIKGMTFRKYQQKKLLEQALEFLTKQEEMSEKQISFALGYRSPKAFSRFIKASAGKTPSQIRREAEIKGSQN